MPAVLGPVCAWLLSAILALEEDDDPFTQRNGTTCLHIVNDSNQRTRNQFRPRNATKGTSSYQLRQYAEATLGGGSLRKIVKLPEGEDENEWLAVNSKRSGNLVEVISLIKSQWSISTTTSTSSTAPLPSSVLHNHVPR